VREVVITAAETGRRLDKFLMAYLSDASRVFIYKLLRKKRIKLNGKRAEGAELLKAGDAITLHLSQETLDSCRNIAEHISPSLRGEAKAIQHKPLLWKSSGLRHNARNGEDDAFWHNPDDQSGQHHNNPDLKIPPIVYEDENLLIINKPAGMASHGGMKGKDSHLLARVLQYLRETGAYPPGATFTPALCNRLDVNTSGLVICGKNYQALRAVNALFAISALGRCPSANSFGGGVVLSGGVDKEYLAVVDGQLHGSAVLEGNYQKDTAANIARITNADREPQAITAYKSLAVSNGRTLLAVNPITGRSHQIRAHLASIGHPLSGDKKYGGKPTSYASAQLLHCRRLTFNRAVLSYPVGMSWAAALPDGFVKCIAEEFRDCDKIRHYFY